MEISPLTSKDLSAAASLFTDHLRRLLLARPELPETMEKPAEVLSRLHPLQAAGRVLAASRRGRLLGYLGWFIVPNFRSSRRTAAYCPEWAHAAEGEDPSEIYQALYRRAAELWFAEKCQLHSLTLLANDPLADKFWFWSGFGMLVVDAVRSLAPVHASLPAGFQVRQASAADAQALSTLDIEHCRHYAASPVFMPAMQPTDTAGFQEFLSQPGKTAWLALKGAHPVGFMRFEPGGPGCDVVAAADTIGITGAYVRPEHRGKHLAGCMLESALQSYARLGFTRCAVDFEATNPPAAAFWLRHFKPVCYSILRAPESYAS